MWGCFEGIRRALGGCRDGVRRALAGAEGWG